MRFTFYTTKTVKQCMSALKERMESPGTKSRPALGGSVQKDGKFTLTLTAPTLGERFPRTTKLRGTATRESGVTVLSGYVPTGVPRRRFFLVLGAAFVVAVIMLLNGDGLLGIVVALLGTTLYIPLVGDHQNQAVLVKELRRATNAKIKPPK